MIRGSLVGHCSGRKAVKDKKAGWLVRTKRVDSDDGGVATGFVVFDLIVLVDV